MKLLFYSSGEDLNKKRLEAAVYEVIPKSIIEPFTSLDDLRSRLQKPVEPDSIAVLLASNREELQKMQMLRSFLPEIYVVLVLPDRKKMTIRLAHLLLPRFLTQKNSDFADLKSVLSKMYLNAQHSRDGEKSLEDYEC